MTLVSRSPRHLGLVALTALLAGCTEVTSQPPVATCTVVDNDDGTRTLRCPDGTSIDLSDDTPAPVGLTQVVDEPAGNNCPRGGHRVESGADVDGDGVLQAAEVETTTYLCDSGGACTVTDHGDGTATIDCPDGSVTVGNSSCTVTDHGDGTATIDCPDGSVTVGNPSCTVVDNGDGTVTLSCADGSSVTVGSTTQGVVT